MTDLSDLFGEPIHIYTRAQAIDDGVLVDVTELAREAGFTIPVALTREVWNECVEVPAGAEGTQDETGRLWDVLFVLSAHIRRGAGGDTVHYEIRVVTTGGGQVRIKRLKAVCGPGDSAEPVITVMFPHES